MLITNNIVKKVGIFKTFKNCKSVNNLLDIITSIESRKEPKKLKMQRKWRPDLYKWQQINLSKGIRSYKLLSYNILAQDLLVEHLHLYYDIDSKLLRWETRLNKIKDEIANIQPDILCLQEMQYNHLKELVHNLSSVGKNPKFEYVFKKKTGTRSDGCAIIYDRNKFKIMSEQCVEYYADGISTLNRENIGLMVKFQPLEDTSMPFVVATTHLLYNPRREDVRISQVNKLIRAIIDFSSNPLLTGRLPVILTGDFNFTPNSRAFQILTAKRKFKTNSDESEVNQLSDDFFQMNAIDFENTYGASTYQDEWITVDYILLSSTEKNTNSIRINSAYKLPSVEQCWRNGKIPNTIIGSDHFSLAIQFSLH